MKLNQFLLPDLGEGLEEAQLVQWLVAEGESVTLNQPLCQVETAKALVDIPSPHAGRVHQLHARPGDSVAVGAPLITIATDAPMADAKSPRSGSGAVLVGYGTEGPTQSFVRRRRGTSRDTSAPATPTRELRASPLVRKMARERGFDLQALTGTGPGGRIRVVDLEAALHAGPPAAAGRVEGPAPLAADEERVSIVGLRKAIAARMVKAATTIPHFSEYLLFDAYNLTLLRDRLNGDSAHAGQKLTFLPFLVRALAQATTQYPILNSRWDDTGSAIILKKTIHMGIATDTERGLVVPVIHDVAGLSLREIAAESERLALGARGGTLTPRDMTGGSITLSNVGAAGPVDTGTPLINPPEACVVGFGAIKKRALVVGEEVKVRPSAWISMSCDHRVVDGATAAKFIGLLAELLEHPDWMAA
ncbi:MAG TPA: dihydrolipoamide acetyltransferase family protein [Ktedonobacterales bacterium]